MTLVAVDAGRTTIRARAWRDGAAGPVVEVPGAPSILEADGEAVSVRALAEAVDACAPEAAAVQAVAVGLAGLGQRADAGAGLARALQGRLPAAAVLLASDVVAWHAGALDGGAGVVLAAGTGAVALAVDAHGRAVRVDGWGHLLGDEGSGYALGRAGLAAVLRAADGRGRPTALTAAAVARFGGLERIVPGVHGGAHPVRAIAAFAPAVLAAAGDGDPVAEDLCARAGAALAATARAAAEAPGLDLPAPRVSLAGGLLADASPVRSALLDALGDLPVATAEGDALDGALRLARQPGGLHRTLVQRWPPARSRPITTHGNAAPHSHQDAASRSPSHPTATPHPTTLPEGAAP